MSTEAESLPVTKGNSNRDAIQKLQKHSKGLKEISAEDAKCISSVDDPKKEYQDKTKYIKKHFKTVMQVAEYLRCIHDKRLYRLEYNTFEEYLQTEFNYTRGRGYQLIDADKVAYEMNEKLGKTVITNESQCRELLRLKIYTNIDHQKVDNVKTSRARLGLLERLIKDKSNVKTSDIAKEVDKLLEAETRNQSITVNEYNERFESTCRGVSKVLENIFKDDNLKPEDKVSIKDNAIKELEEVLRKLKDGNSQA